MELMRSIPSRSIDMVLCDLPYGITQNKWDCALPLSDLWGMYESICKPAAVIVLTASQPFTSTLVMSKKEWFRHEWIWIKNRGSNFANTVREPFKEHEEVLVFSQGKWTYNKQMQERTGSGGDRVKYGVAFRTHSTNYGFEKRGERGPKQLPKMRVPSSWQKFNTDTSGLHPTIKPVALMEYLIKTYTNRGDTVLDNCMGSGTTVVAAKNLGRRCIGIESDPKYFQIAKKRIETIFGIQLIRTEINY